MQLEISDSELVILWHRLNMAAPAFADGYKHKSAGAKYSHNTDAFWKKIDAVCIERSIDPRTGIKNQPINVLEKRREI